MNPLPQVPNSPETVRVIGLISGTSVDGIDGVLVDLHGQRENLQLSLLEYQTFPYSSSLRSDILSVIGGASLSMADFAQLDDRIAREFAQVASMLQQGYSPPSVIGSHGQTVYHRPPDADSLGYSLQLGRGELIAHLTGVTTVSNFRVADLAVQGQGAPLVPIVDACLLTHPSEHRCIQNLGGIGNVTYLPPSTPLGISTGNDGVMGWDTGPGNVLLDLAVQYFSQGSQRYDQEGIWSSQGTPCQELVEKWLQQPFFWQKPPKSTGRELFGSDYFQDCLRDCQFYSLEPADVLATLTELTVLSIVHSYRSFLPKLPDEVFLCGGGSHNLYLKRRLEQYLHPIPISTTTEVGFHADAKEAIAFAILAYWRILGIPGNLPQVTGAKSSVLLGEIHPAYSSP